MKLKALFFLFFCMIPSLISCAPSMKAGVPRKEVTFQELQSYFAGREREFQSIKGMVSLSIIPVHGSHQNMNGILSFEKRENLRFQGFDPLGRTVLDLMAVGDAYQFALEGNPPIRGNLTGEEGTRLRIGPGEKDSIHLDEWLKILKEFRWGGAPIPGKDEVMFIDAEEENLLCSILKIRGKEGILRKKIWLNRLSLDPVKEELYEESGSGDHLLAGAIFYENFKREKNGSWPGRIKVKLPEGEFLVEFLEINFSPAFPPDYFKIR